MNRARKDDTTTTILMLAELVGRHYGLSDDTDPQVHIGALPAHLGNATHAFYSPSANTLHFRPTYLYGQVIMHELAHWAQYALRGDTDCSSTPIARRNLTLAAEHSVMQKTITALAQRTGYYAALNALGDLG